MWCVGALRIREIVGWCIMGSWLKPRTTGATSGSFKLQCIAVVTFSSAVCSGVGSVEAENRWNDVYYCKNAQQFYSESFVGVLAKFDTTYWLISVLINDLDLVKLDQLLSYSKA